MQEQASAERPSAKHFTWVEGYEGLEMTDKKGWINVAWEVMPGWKAIDQKRISLKDISGYGGSRTFMVEIKPRSADKAPEHTKIILRARKATQDDDPYQEQRMESSQKVLYDAGLAIPRLFEGKTFNIEPCVEDLRPQNGWFKSFIFNIMCVDTPKGEQAKFAALLAKVHKVPTEWYEPIRQGLQTQYPMLKTIGNGSHAWIITSRLEWWGVWRKKMTNEEIQFYFDCTREPLSEAGKKIITSHGDFHEGNVMIDKPTGKYLAIDLEFTTVQYAAGGIAYIFSINSMGTSTVEGRKSFVKAYLEASGYPFEPEDVDLLVFDAQCARIRHHWIGLLTGSMWNMLKWKDWDHSCYKLFSEFEDEARKSTELQKKIADSEFYAVACEDPKRGAAITEFIRVNDDNVKGDRVWPEEEKAE